METLSVHTVERGNMPLFSGASGSLTSLEPPRVVVTFSGDHPEPCEPGRSARIEIDPPRAIAGKVVKSSKEGPASSGCEIELSDPVPGDATIGKRIGALVQVGEMRDVVFFGRPAGSSADSIATIFLLEPGSSSARRVTVRYGKKSGPLIQVVEGLAPGDRVIVTDMSNWEKYPRVRIQSSDDELFQRFLAWLASRPATARPTDLVVPFRAELIKGGLSDQEANRQLSKLWQRAYRDPEGSRILWNKIYAAKEEPIFVTRPSAFLMRMIERVRPGKALDVGMGQGRNAIFLASRGWDVTGFDPSDEAVRIARENAEKLGVTLKTVIARDDQFAFETEQWDLIVMTFIRTPTKADADKFWDALRPSGLVVYEDGADDDHSVLDAFHRFRIRFFEDVEDYGDWNPQVVNRHQRFVAEKPKKP